ncbi:MAG: hypothetical protein JKY67_22865 [Pseudomonadales bacterium]|nr:hypothetical protein [Pseudomonadales bacterium]
MMLRSSIWRTVVALFFALLMVACGTENSGDLAEGGIEGTGITDDATYVSIGSITGFGSIFVNGVEYDTDSSAFLINDDDGSETQLKLAMVVTIEGGVNEDGSTGIADRVVFDRDVKGPISTITTLDSSNKLIIVLGLEIGVNEDIVFEGVSFATLEEGDVVEASGFINAEDQLVATRIEKLADAFQEGDKIEVEAKITTVDLDQQLFSLNSLTVDYSQAILVRLPNDSPGVGDFVEVKASGFTELGYLLADKVKYKGERPNVGEGDKLELEGVISEFVSASEFTIRGITVNAENAIFKKGSITDLAAGIKVEVEGRINTSDVLEASEVTIKLGSSIKISAPVAGIDSGNGVITLLSVDLTVDEQTSFQDTGLDQLKYFNLDHVEIGDWLMIRATLIGDEVIASQIVRLEEKTHVTLNGPVESVDLEMLTILGVSVDISAVPDEDKIEIDLGDILSATGQISGDIIFVTELEREDDD